MIYSMTTSSPEDAPRGMESLYSLNRFNVATSRARCVCILVANPKLFEPEFVILRWQTKVNGNIHQESNIDTSIWKSIVFRIPNRVSCFAKSNLQESNWETFGLWL